MFLDTTVDTIIDTVVDNNTDMQPLPLLSAHSVCNHVRVYGMHGVRMSMYIFPDILDRHCRYLYIFTRRRTGWYRKIPGHQRF